MWREVARSHDQKTHRLGETFSRFKKNHVYETDKTDMSSLLSSATAYLFWGTILTMSTRHVSILAAIVALALSESAAAFPSVLRYPGLRFTGASKPWPIVSASAAANAGCVPVHLILFFSFLLKSLICSA
jgi:hypothetical protein